MHIVIAYVIAALLFGIGVYGVLRRRNAVLVLMAVELMLNAVNVIFVAADASAQTTPVGGQGGGLPYSGGVFALFVIVLAAAEIGVGLAIVLQFYRLRAGVALTDVSLDPVAATPTAGPDDVASDDVASDGVAQERVSG